MNTELLKLLKEVEYELTVHNGLVVYDDETAPHTFKIDTTEALKRWKP